MQYDDKFQEFYNNDKLPKCLTPQQYAWRAMERSRCIPIFFPRNKKNTNKCDMVRCIEAL